MLGNGIANIVAASILAGAIVWTGGFGGKKEGLSEEELARVYARAVGDIKTDVVVNCGCCGEGERKAQSRPF
jgi:hypothetical protein